MLPLAEIGYLYPACVCKCYRNLCKYDVFSDRILIFVCEIISPTFLFPVPPPKRTSLLQEKKNSP